VSRRDRAGAAERPPGPWRPLAPGHTRRAAMPTGPFARMARTHAFMSAGDTLVALALAGSLFFSISPDAARTRVALYLVLTMAPFAVVAPLIGPWIDRKEGGRRSMVVLSAGARAALCVVMIDSLDSLLLFPLAFAVLVLGKGYQVARTSLVPGLVRDESELVEANAKLTLISGIGGFVAAVPGALVLQLGAPWVLVLAAVVFGVGTLTALRIPRTAVAVDRVDQVERAELRSAGIVLAASAMAVLRGVVGFLAFFAAFYLRSDEAPALWFGVVLGTSGVGALVGAAVAPAVRRHVREERILLASLALVTVGAVFGLNMGGRSSMALVAAVVGVSAGAGKLAFDSIVQRDAPHANRGRSFARFETRFQLIWVVGAFLPVVIPVPLGVGYVGMAVVCAAAAFSYATGRRLSAPERVRRRVRVRANDAARRLGWRPRGAG
jgi:hypothetical protein